MPGFRWLCRIGVHRFRPYAYNSFVNPFPVEECTRCGIGQQFHLAGFTTRYTREQMTEARVDFDRRKAAAAPPALRVVGEEEEHDRAEA